MKILITWAIVLALDLAGYGVVYRVDDSQIWIHFRDLVADNLPQRDGRTGRQFTVPLHGGRTYHIALHSYDETVNRSRRTVQVVHVDTATGDVSVTEEPIEQGEIIVYNVERDFARLPAATEALIRDMTRRPFR